MFGLFKKRYLYFPGCLTKSFLPEIVENYKKLMRSLGIDFDSPETFCCGAIAYNNGYTKDFEDLREKNLGIFDGEEAKVVVTNCGYCLEILKKLYGLEAYHISEVLIKKEKKLPVKFDEKVTYYGGVQLDFKEEPKLLLESVGFDVVELSKKNLICGAEGGMIQNVPKIANRLAKNIFDLCETKKLIVSDPLVYYHLKKNAPAGIQVLELSEVLR